MVSGYEGSKDYDGKPPGKYEWIALVVCVAAALLLIYLTR